ncbi:MAG: hypothetical protein MUQ65_04875 [Armatimonadetes bacterium]|nr:hypothetical protein [Armatimonadota bacterium]
MVVEWAWSIGPQEGFVRGNGCVGKWGIEMFMGEMAAAGSEMDAGEGWRLEPFQYGGHAPLGGAVPR